MRGNKTIATVLLWACAVTAHAAPAINSAAISNGVITMAGSGFGTKPQPGPIRADGFEGLTPGANISAATGWWEDSTSVTNRMVISADHAFSGTQSAKAAQTWAQVTVGGNPQAHKSDVGFATTRKAFVSLWVRWHWPEWSGGTPADGPTNEQAFQFKLFRLASTVEASGNVIYPAVNYFPWKDYAGIGIDRTLVTIPYSAGTPGGLPTLYSPNNHLVNDQWHNIVMIVDQGTKGVADGKVKVLTSKPGTTYIALESADGVMVIDSLGDYLDDIKLDNYMDINNPSIVAAGATVNNPGIYYDDIYIDNTFQRLELGDASTYAACTKRIVQPATAWSDTGITATLNTGNLPTGSQAYLYVADASGAISPPYGPITMGSGSGLRRLGIRVSE